MKPAIFATFDYDIPFERAIPMIRQAGFQAVSFGCRTEYSGYDTIQGRAAVARCLAQNDLVIDSLHAPFPKGDRLFSLDDAQRQESICMCRMAVDAAAELDGKIVVLHLIQPYDIPHGDVRNRMIDRGRDSVAQLADHAAVRGVKLALENGQRRDYDQVLIDLLMEFNVDHVGLCYDSGHEHVQGTCFALLEQFGDRLFTVHLHDNCGTDTHMLPYEGTIDWEAFRTILHGMPYAGNVLLEVGVANSQFKDPQVFLTQARQCAEKILQVPGR